MVRLLGVAFDLFRQIEPLNPEFVAGRPKMRVTVDAEPDGGAVVEESLPLLREGFPGLARHRCHAGAESGRRAAGIRLVAGESTANQAHLFEHVVLEMLAVLEAPGRRSGVTCAYVRPAERSDVFVECEDPEAGLRATLLGVEAMNAVLAGQSVAPLFPDALRALRAIRARRQGSVSAAWLARSGRMSGARAAAVLGLLARVRLLESERYAVNLSGEPHYRFVGAGEVVAPEGEERTRRE